MVIFDKRDSIKPINCSNMKESIKASMFFPQGGEQ